MTWALRAVVLALLGTAAWKVYAVRGRLGQKDADPAAVRELENRLAALPLDIAEGRFLGRPNPFDADLASQSGADHYASILYRDEEGQSFHLYVGGSIGNQENFHTPSYCMPSHGWEVVGESTVPFNAYPVAQKDRRMRRLLLQFGTERMLVYYWFQAGSRVIDHDLKLRVDRFLDLLAGEPFRPTLIITLYVPMGETLEQTETAATEFLRALGPHLRDATVGQGAE